MRLERQASAGDPELYGSSRDLHAGPVSGCLFCKQASIALVPLTRFPVPAVGCPGQLQYVPVRASCRCLKGAPDSFFT